MTKIIATRIIPNSAGLGLGIIWTNNNWIIYWAKILKRHFGDKRGSNSNAVLALEY
jgi:hypothetical protein